MKASSLEKGLRVIGRTSDRRSSASATSSATSTRPSERSKTTPPSGIAGRSQTKSTGGSTLSRGLPAHGLGGDQGRVEARGNAIIVIITKQASGRQYRSVDAGVQHHCASVALQRAVQVSGSRARALVNRTCWAACSMSALPLKATEKRTFR